VSASQVATSLAGFVIFYTALAVVDAILMVRYTKKGPDGLGMWPESPARPALAAAHQE
jgi:cytochrome d ubiquinol oxidase subunit I